jgi:hypothetical protein
VSEFGQIVRRVEELDPPSVSDPQVEEATRSCLYGFHRSAVVGVAAALEARLKRLAKKNRIESYEALIRDAKSAGLLILRDACAEKEENIYRQALREPTFNSLAGSAHPPTATRRGAAEGERCPDPGGVGHLAPRWWPGRCESPR